MELSRIIDPNFGLLVWSALDVVSVDIAVAQSPLPSARGIEGGKDGIDRCAAREIVTPGNLIHVVYSGNIDRAVVPIKSISRCALTINLSQKFSDFLARGYTS
jgi:hypothetical protein